MTYRPVPFRSFGRGLNLRDAPDVVDEAEAIDCLNVIFSEQGAVRQREGYAKFTSSALTNQPDSLSAFYKSDGTKRLVVGNGNRLDVLDTTGASVANSTAPTANPHYFARFGGPTVEAVYIANGTDQIRRYDTAGGFTAPAGLSGQTGRFLAVTPTSNRLVVARESGTTLGNNPSSVNFSNAGDPETFIAANALDLDPGDGEAIMGVVTWGPYVLIFKETKFWVHYGESTTAIGGSEFQVRKVKGAGLAASQALTATTDGVYFMARDGVYRTTGGEPQRVSDAIQPIFTGNPSDYFRSSTLNHSAITACAMWSWQRRIYLAYPSGASSTNDRLLVFDPLLNWWSIWDIPAAAGTSFRISSTEEMVFAYPAGDNHVGRHSGRDRSYTSDDMAAGGTGGTAMTARWRSGWQNYGSGEMKTIRETKLWGSGNVTVSLSKDFDYDQFTSAAVSFSGTGTDTWDPLGVDAWGSGAVTDFWEPQTTINPKLMRKAIKGTVFSTQFENTTQDLSFAVHRLDHHLRESRPPNVVETGSGVTT